VRQLGPLQAALVFVFALGPSLVGFPSLAIDDGLPAEGLVGGTTEHVTLQVDPALSLSELVRQVAAREYGASAVEARRDEAKALRSDARRIFSDTPTLGGSLVSDQAFGNDGYRQWDSNLELPLWWPGQLSARRRKADAADAALPFAAEAHSIDVAGWVRGALAEIELARLRLGVAESRWHSSQALAAQVEEAVALEELARRDLILARSTALEHELEYLEALEEARHSRSTYFLLTQSTRLPLDWFEEPTTDLELDRHPLLLLANEELVRAEADVRRLAGDRFGSPVLSIGTQHERDVSGSPFSDRIVAGVRIPLGSVAAPRTAVAAARRNLAEARRDAGRLERRIRGEVEKAEHRLEIAGERIATASAQAALSAEYREMTQKSFELGEADLPDVLRARARFDAAELNRQEAILMRHVSAAALNQALGVLP
jgi:outer membrane protein TolC